VCSTLEMALKFLVLLIVNVCVLVPMSVYVCVHVCVRVLFEFTPSPAQRSPGGNTQGSSRLDSI
jgi:hypothetical protein